MTGEPVAAEELVRTLVNGPDDEARRRAQARALEPEIDRKVLRKLLLHEIRKHSSIKTWGVRAWLLSTLGRVSKGDSESADEVLAHLDPQREREPWVRHWTLEGLWAGQNPHLSIREVRHRDDHPLVVWLVRAIEAFTGDQQAMRDVRGALADPDQQNFVLRALRIVPLRPLRNEVAAVQQQAGNKEIHWNARKALERMEEGAKPWERQAAEELAQRTGRASPAWMTEPSAQADPPDRAATPTTEPLNAPDLEISPELEKALRGGPGVPGSVEAAAERWIEEQLEIHPWPQLRLFLEQRLGPGSAGAIVRIDRLISQRQPSPESGSPEPASSPGRPIDSAAEGWSPPRVWLAAARGRDTDWQETLRSEKLFEWRRITGSDAKGNLAKTRPGDIALLYRRGESSEQALVGWAEVEGVLWPESRESPSVRLRPRGAFREPVAREALERAVPDLHHLKYQGAFTEVTPEQWAVLREILRQREPDLDHELPKATVEEKLTAELVAVAAPKRASASASLPRVPVTVRNAGNSTWRRGEVLRFAVEVSPADIPPPDVLSGFSGTHTVAEDVPPGSELQASTDISELPAQPGKHVIRWDLFADEDRWGPGRRLARVEHAIEIEQVPPQGTPPPTRFAGEILRLKVAPSVESDELSKVQLSLRNTGTATWEELDRFRVDYEYLMWSSEEKQTLRGWFYTLDEPVPPRGEVQIESEYRAPSAPGDYVMRVSVYGDSQRWGTDSYVGEKRVKQEVRPGRPIDPKQEEQASEHFPPPATPESDLEAEIGEMAVGPQMAGADTGASDADPEGHGEPGGLKETAEPAKVAPEGMASAGVAEPNGADEPAPGEDDAEPEHVTQKQLERAGEVGPPSPASTPLPMNREVQVLRELYRPPPAPKKLTLRIGADAVNLQFGSDEYKSPTRIDSTKLRGLGTQPIEYGHALFGMVINDGRLPGSSHESTLFGYRKALEATDGELRFELVIDSPSPELRGLAWERLHDGSDRPPIATSERTPFYRRVQFREPELAEPPLEVLVAISNPRVLRSGDNQLLANLSPLEAAEEAEAIEAGLRPLKEAGLLEYEILGSDPEQPLQFEDLSEALQNKVQVLHLLAHGLYDRDAEYCIAIESRNGARALVPAAKFAQALLAGQKGLRLVVLEACRSGEVALDGATGAALGTILVRAGLPAVISMRENLGVKTARYFNQRFYLHLARSEHVEMALAATRFDIYQRKIEGENSWSIPVLHLGVTTGRLFGVDPLRAPRLEDVEPKLVPVREAERPLAAMGGVAEAVRAAGAGGPLDEEGIRRISEAAVRAAGDAQPLARLQNRRELSATMLGLVRLKGKELAEFVGEKTKLGVPPLVYDQAASALNSGKHVVFIGPPGTGKTSLAHAIADYAAEQGFSAGIIPTTASADWTTFDTVGGYVPVSAERLEFRPGLFLRAIATGRWLVLDEINRAEIDKAVGELFTVLSGQQVDLPYRVRGQPVRILPARRNPHPRNWVPDEATGEYDYVVHPNWRILATMNVYDKSSLFGMSFAFMRRFAFVDVGVPDEKAIFRKLRDGWIDVWEDAVVQAYGGDHDRARTVLDTLKAKLAEVFAVGDGALMRRRELGPAIAQDMIRYVFDRFTHDPECDFADLAREAFLLYAVPQLDGLDRQAVLDVYGYLAKVFYPEAIDQPDEPVDPFRPRAVLDRLADLYPHIQQADWARALRERRP